MNKNSHIDHDFIIQSPPLTKEEIKEISEFIKMRKAENLTTNKLKSKIKNRKTSVKLKEKA